MLRDPGLAIVDADVPAGGDGGPPSSALEPGTPITIKDPYTGRTRTLTVAALAPSDYFIANGVFYGSTARARSSATGSRSTGSTSALGRASTPTRSPRDAQAKFIANGAEAYSIEAIMDEGFTMTRQIFQLFQGYLAMGLIVGIAGTAVVMVRAVRERRRQIGTLRALGLRRAGRSGGASRSRRASSRRREP